MARRAPSNIREYYDIARRRRWWLLIPAVLVAVGTFFVTLALPREYRSETSIMVDPQKVPTNYVQSSVSSDVGNRLQAISQEILSRARLQKIIDQFGLYRATRARMSNEEIVDLMRRNISIEIDAEQSPDDRNKRLVSFKIAYTGSDPGLVQQVTRQLASAFIEENLKDREQEAEGTTEFLKNQLEHARLSLQDQEKQIQEYKTAHAGELPDQLQSNTQMSGQLQVMLNSTADAISRAQQQKNYLSTLLDAMKNAAPPPQSAKTTLELDYEAKRAELIAAEQKYRAKHPDVVRLRAELAEIKTQLSDENAQHPVNADGRVVSPEQAQAEIQGLNDEIKRYTARQHELEDQVHQLQSRMIALPQVEQRLADLTRDYDVSKLNYQNLEAKLNSSSIAADVERHADGEQFRILDAASNPEKPSKPNLAQIDIMGLLVGLTLGAALALMVELTDNTMHNESDVSFYATIPVLASIPLVLNQEERRRISLRHLWIGVGSGSATLIVLVALFLLRSSIATGFGWKF
jgi:polysaccharide chain length determinant protein (PEP-CTERM system associated)